MKTITEVLALLKDVHRTSNGYKTLCPVHDDHSPTLDVSIGQKGGILFDCKAGCSFESIIAAIGLEPKDVCPDKPSYQPVTYSYCNADGKLLYQKVRKTLPNGKKSFHFQRPNKRKAGEWILNLKDVDRILYHQYDLPTESCLYICEGEKDVDRLRSLGLHATTNDDGAHGWTDANTGQLFEHHPSELRVMEDNDDEGRARSADLAFRFHAQRVPLRVIALPGLGIKGDVSDWLDGGHTLAELLAICDATPLYTPPLVIPPVPKSLDELHVACRKRFGAAYDLDAMTATVAVAAAEQLDGDPLWLVVISGSGATKTETVSVLTGVGAIVTGTLSSIGALLSGSSKKEQAPGATGGLLVQIGARGILVIKDLTSILSMNVNTRSELLAALREVYDGMWVRDVGADGGKRLIWKGRLAVVAAVTTAWDKHHEVIATMGDRFVSLRVNSNLGRVEAGHQSLANIGHETEMRTELAELVAGVITGMRHDVGALTSDEEERLFAAADLVTRGRTAVDHDWHGNVIDSHAPEYPTRFLKQLAQLMRGAMAIGLERHAALQLALRCARDSMPPLRLLTLQDIAAHPGSQRRDVWRRLGKPRKTVDRCLEDLHQLGLLTEREQAHDNDIAPAEDPAQKSTWHYSLADGVNPEVLEARPDFIPYCTDVDEAALW